VNLFNVVEIELLIDNAQGEAMMDSTSATPNKRQCTRETKA
jgi:hypothetical protein